MNQAILSGAVCSLIGFQEDFIYFLLNFFIYFFGLKIDIQRFSITLVTENLQWYFKNGSLHHPRRDIQGHTRSPGQ
jgi:hypothetical protein